MPLEHPDRSADWSASAPRSSARSRPRRHRRASTEARGPARDRIFPPVPRSTGAQRWSNC